MEGHIKPIGGEFWFDSSVLDNNEDNFKDLEAVFLSGGQSALQFIIEDINFKDDEYILMPSYLCPTILYNFKRKNINFIFYGIDEDLSINLKDVQNKINSYKVKAVFFIDYFGFYHNNKAIDFLRKIQKKGIVLIEDAVQMLWFSKKQKFIGDYIFNSYRKFLPIDGSLVLCNKSIKFNELNDKYNRVINEARLKKTRYIKYNTGSEEEFLSLYKKADEEYYKRKDIIGTDTESKEMLSKVDYKFIFNKRKENYSYLYDELIENDKIQIIYDKKLIDNNSVLGLPILINNRDEVRKKLREFNIYCPVHWDILKEDWSNKYDYSRYVSRKIITIPIDQRYDMDFMKTMVHIIKQLCGI